MLAAAKLRPRPGDLYGHYHYPFDHEGPLVTHVVHGLDYYRQWDQLQALRARDAVLLPGALRQQGQWEEARGTGMMFEWDSAAGDDRFLFLSLVGVYNGSAHNEKEVALAFDLRDLFPLGPVGLRPCDFLSDLFSPIVRDVCGGDISWRELPARCRPLVDVLLRAAAEGGTLWDARRIQRIGTIYSRLVEKRWQIEYRTWNDRRHFDRYGWDMRAWPPAIWKRNRTDRKREMATVAALVRQAFQAARPHLPSHHQYAGRCWRAMFDRTINDKAPEVLFGGRLPLRLAKFARDAQGRWRAL